MAECVVVDGVKLNAERIARGMTRGEVAIKARVHLNSVLRALSGGRVTLRVGRAVAGTLGFSLREVIVTAASGAVVASGTVDGVGGETQAA